MNMVEHGYQSPLTDFDFINELYNEFMNTETYSCLLLMLAGKPLNCSFSQLMVKRHNRPSGFKANLKLHFPVTWCAKNRNEVG